VTPSHLFVPVSGPDPVPHPSIEHNPGVLSAAVQQAQLRTEFKHSRQNLIRKGRSDIDKQSKHPSMYNILRLCLPDGRSLASTDVDRGDGSCAVVDDARALDATGVAIPRVRAAFRRRGHDGGDDGPRKEDGTEEEGRGRRHRLFLLLLACLLSSRWMLFGDEMSENRNYEDDENGGLEEKRRTIVPLGQAKPFPG